MRWIGWAGAFLAAGIALADITLAQSPRIEAQRKVYEQLKNAWQVPSAGGQAVPVLYGRHAKFTFFGDIAISVEEAVSLLKPAASGQPVVLDDPFSFSIEMLDGTIVLAPARSMR